MNTEAIARLLDQAMKIIYARFYSRLNIRLWMRDRNDLTKSVARYGHECCKRGWDLSAEDISRDLLRVLNRVTPPDHQWLPKYLESCVDLHIRSRAEELSALAKTRSINRVVNSLKSSVVPAGVVVREKTPVEIMSDIYIVQSRIRRTRHTRSDQSKSEKYQMKLL